MIHTDASTQCSLKVLPYDSEEAIVRQNFLGERRQMGHDQFVTGYLT